MGRFFSVRALLRLVVKLTWSVLEASWAVFGRLGALLGASSCVSERSWAMLEARRGLLGLAGAA
eukprot:6982831-Pyramimonas_sp.AAC.1